MDTSPKPTLHIAMYPWFALGHITSFLRLANKFASRGHTISFFLPTKTLLKFDHHNHHPTLISLIPIAVPPIDGLPPGAETTADIPSFSAIPLLMSAMDLTRPAIDESLARLRPDLLFFDFAGWVPGLARNHGARSVNYITVQVSFMTYMSLRARGLPDPAHLTESDLRRAPPGFPAEFSLRAHEARKIEGMSKMPLGPYGSTFLEMVQMGFGDCDAVCFRSCREMEGEFGDYFERLYEKPVLWAGPVVPEQPGSGLNDEEMDEWLKGFEEGSVVYCALGSECVLSKEQFHELVLGLELTGLPFLAALKPPMGYNTIKAALPDGFLERIKARGIVHEGWVQQPNILNHPSVGCFVTHCGSGSLFEALVSDCQMVLMPHRGDQILNARLFSGHLRIGIEVHNGEDNDLFTREAIHKAIVIAMDPEDEIAKEIRSNHAKWREFLLKDELEESYITSLIDRLQALLT